jgi:methyl-accepting chemotaxis protein
MQIASAMDQGASHSRECAGSANSANQLLELVLASVLLIDERSRHITAAVEQQSEVTEGIAKNSVKIAAIGRFSTEDYVQCKQYHSQIN